MIIKLTIYLDNGEINVFSGPVGFFERTTDGISIEEGGRKQLINWGFIRKIITVEMA